GDPIPDAKGRMQRADATPLSKLSPGDCAEVARVTDQQPRFLAFAGQHGLRPGIRLRVLKVVPEAESLPVRADGCDAVSLSFQAAARVLVANVTRPGVKV
ncbi:MAG: FeoA family protein, partial [Planctomycetota bacterium]